MRLGSVLRLIAFLVVVQDVAAQPAKMPRLDLQGDPLPDGAVVRLGSLRFQPGPEESNQISRNFRILHFYGNEPASVLAPDGTTVLTTSGDSDSGIHVSFLDTRTGKRVRQLDLGKIGAMRLRFTPDGKSLVFSTGSGLTFIDPVTGKVVRSVQSERIGGSGIALNADASWVAAQPSKNVYDAPVSILDSKTGKEVASLPGRGAMCTALTFSPDSKRLLLWSTVPTQVSDGSISYDATSKVALVCIDIEKRKIIGETNIGTTQGAALSPDGETVALAAADHQTVRVRHLPTNTERCSIPVKHASMTFAPAGKVLCTVDENGLGALWDASKGVKIRDLDGPLANKDFQILGISKEGGTIAVVDGGYHSDPIVVVWDAATGKRADRPPGHEGTITCLAYAADGKVLASGSIDRTVRLWNPATGAHLRIATVHKEAITALALSSDGKLLASSSQSGAIRVSNLANGKDVAEFTGPFKGATALTFSQEGTVLYAGGTSAEVLAWEIVSGKEVLRMKTGEDGTVMAFGNGGALAVTANGEIRAENTPERLQVWKLATRLPIAALPLRDDRGGRARCEGAVFSPEGRLLASSQISEYHGLRLSYGHPRLRLWERLSGREIRTLSPTITRLLAFSSNGRLLASGTAGGEGGQMWKPYGAGIDVWDTVTGKKVGGGLPVTPECVAFSPEGTQLATGGRDHTVLIWPVPALQPGKETKAPTAEERDAWWLALGGDAKDAYKAIGQMMDAPDSSVALVKERVRPVPRCDADQVARLIARLDSKVFAERAEAQKALEQMGEVVAPLLKKAMEDKVNLELHRRLQDLVSRTEEASSAEFQQLRAVALLEWIGTPAARAVLRKLADGAPGVRLTTEAQAALKRLPD